MSNPNNELDDFQVFEGNIDYGEAPQSVPFDESAIDMYGISEQESEDLAILKAFSSLTPSDLESPPEHLLSSAITIEDQEPLTAIQQFLMQNRSL